MSKMKNKFMSIIDEFEATTGATVEMSLLGDDFVVYLMNRIINKG